MTLFITKFQFYTLYSYGALLVHVSDVTGEMLTSRLKTDCTVDWDKIHRMVWTEAR
jgi:hypothetical protein